MANHYNAIFLRNRIGFKPWSFSLAVLAVSYRLRDTIYIDSCLFGSLTSAIVGTLTYFSTVSSYYKNLPLVLGNLGIYPGHPLGFYSFAY
jgi:hypothetical protein